MKIHIDKKGSWQTGQVGVPLQPLQVCVQDDEGIPVHKLEVRFRLVQGKGRFTHRDAETDAAGCAVAEFVPEAAGLYRVDCLVGGRGGRQTQFTGSAIETAPAPAEETPTTDPATTTAPQPPAAGVALFEEEIEKFVQAEVAASTVDETATVEPMVTTETAEPTANPPADAPPPPAAVDPDSVDAYLDSLLHHAETPAQPETTAGSETAPEAVRTDAQPGAGNEATAAASSSSDETATVVDDPAMSPEPIGVVDEPGTASEPTAPQPETASADEPVVMEEAPPRLSDLFPTEPEETVVAPTPPPVEDQGPEISPKRRPLRHLTDLTKGGKIVLAILALIIAVILFFIARLPGTPKAAITPPPQSGTIDCSGSVIKTVGQTYVFEGCRRVP